LIDYFFQIHPTPIYSTMADVFLIVALTVAFLILLVVAVYLLVYYQHPDDHNDAYFPKLVVIIGIMLAGATCLLLPLDVANNEGYAGTFVPMNQSKRMNQSINQNESITSSVL
jgi:hypothetical protein